MDCEKFEPLLLDELYDELDEVTSAAVKRHVQGCARCSSALNGLRQTRRLAALPLVPVPAGLEDRILAAVKEAQKVVPIQSRMQRALSLAGSWAMRPQTAMAAVFLLMIGTSAFVIRSRHGAMAPQAVSVTENGAPAATAPAAAEVDSLDSKAAAAAHGPNVPQPITSPPVVAAAADKPAASAAPDIAQAQGSLALNNDPNASAGFVDGLTGGKGRTSANKNDEGQAALGSALADGRKEESARDKDGKDRGGEAKKTAARGNYYDAPNAPAPTANRRAGDITNAGPPAGAPYGGDDYAPRAQTVAPPAKAANEQQSDSYSMGMAAYRARNYPEATKQLDAAARSGDQNAALWAAKSVKEGNGGCNSAIPRFDAVAQKASGTWHGAEAQLEAARCQIALGNLDDARTRLAKLQTVASHSSQAQQALNEVNQIAARREAERSRAGAGGGAGASRPAAPAPARAPASPKQAVDSAAGF